MILTVSVPAVTTAYGPTFGVASPAATDVPLTTTSAATAGDRLAATRTRAEPPSVCATAPCWSIVMPLTRKPPALRERMTVTMRWLESRSDGMSMRSSVLSPGVVTHTWYGVVDAVTCVNVACRPIRFAANGALPEFAIVEQAAVVR